MKRDAAYLLDILLAARLIQSYVKGLSREQFDENTMLQDAVCRRIEIIGEATKRISDEFRQQHPEIPWKEMAGMRDVIIHDYDEIDLDVVWRATTISVPTLIPQIEKLVPPDDGSDE